MKAFLFLSFYFFPLMCFAQAQSLSEHPFAGSLFFPEQQELIVYKYDTAILHSHNFHPLFPAELAAADTGIVFIRKSNTISRDPHQDYFCCIVLNYKSEKPGLIVPVKEQPRYKIYSLGTDATIIEIDPGFYFAVNTKTKKSAAPNFKTPISGLKQTEPQYWLRFDIRNVLMCDVVMKKDSFSVGVVDLNGDGIYNTANEDGFVVAPYGKDTVYTIPRINATCQKQAANNYIQFSDHLYCIDKIAPDGKTIRIRQQKKEKTQDVAVIHLFDRFPECYAQSLDTAVGLKKIVDLSGYTEKNQYTLVFFQDLDNPIPDAAFFDSLQQFTQTHPNILSVIIISQYSDQPQILDFNKSRPGDWHYLKYDVQLESDFLICLWPGGYLFDPNKKLISLVNIRTNVAELIK